MKMRTEKYNKYTKYYCSNNAVYGSLKKNFINVEKCSNNSSYTFMIDDKMYKLETTHKKQVVYQAKNNLFLSNTRI